MEYCLTDPVENLRFLEAFAFFLGGDDALVHIAGLAVDHDDAEIAILIGEGILIADNIGMPEFLQQF